MSTAQRSPAATQVSKNREAYEKVRGEIEAKHFGRVVLMHDGEIVSIYNDKGDAYSIGREKYGLGNFSLKTVGDSPISLGVHTLSLSGE